MRRNLIEALTLVRQAQQRVKYWVERLRSYHDKSPEAIEELFFLDYMLEAIATRLETLLVTNIASTDLLLVPIESIRRLLKETSPPPDLQYMINALNDILVNLHGSLMEDYGYSDYYFDEATISSNVKKIMEEARAMAKKRATSLGNL